MGRERQAGLSVSSLPIFLRALWLVRSMFYSPSYFVRLTSYHVSPVLCRPIRCGSVGRVINGQGRVTNVGIRVAYRISVVRFFARITGIVFHLLRVLLYLVRLKVFRRHDGGSATGRVYRSPILYAIRIFSNYSRAIRDPISNVSYFSFFFFCIVRVL